LSSRTEETSAAANGKVATSAVIDRTTPAVKAALKYAHILPHPFSTLPGLVIHPIPHIDDHGVLAGGVWIGGGKLTKEGDVFRRAGSPVGRAGWYESPAESIIARGRKHALDMPSNQSFRV